VLPPTAPTNCDMFGVKNISFDDANPTYPEDDPWKYAEGALDIYPPQMEPAALPART